MYSSLLRRAKRPRCGRALPSCLSSSTFSAVSQTRAVHHFEAPRLADLVLIRHGESEGNVARQRSIDGDHSLFYGEFQNRHSCNWRLTDRGRRQAVAAGEWLKKNDLVHFDRYLVSEYLRALETAGRMELPGAKWYAEMLIRERDWGQMDLMSEQERMIKMQDELRRRDLDRFYYAPPGGESLAAVAQRADRLLDALHRECAGKKAIVVCHGEVMWAMRTRLERMPQDTFHELQESGQMVDQIHNGHILHYTRRDPQTGDMANYFTHMRSVCPWNEKLSPKGWMKIERPVYDNEMLLAIAERVPRMIVSEEYIEKTYQKSPRTTVTVKTSILGFDERPILPHLSAPSETEQSVKEESVLPPILLPAKSMLDLKKVVVVNKTSRFQHECELHGNTGYVFFNFDSHGSSSLTVCCESEQLVMMQRGAAKANVDARLCLRPSKGEPRPPHPGARRHDFQVHLENLPVIFMYAGFHLCLRGILVTLQLPRERH